MFSFSSEAILLYFQISSFYYISSRILQHLSLIFENYKESIALCALLVEIFGTFLVIAFVPKIRAARMLSGILIFIGSLAVIFTSFGTGLFVYFLTVLIILIISISRSSRYLNFILVPFFCLQIYMKLALQLVGMDNKMNAIRMVTNHYVILFIYPAILLLCCQKTIAKSN